MRIAFSLLLAFCLVSCGRRSSDPNKPHVLIRTADGDIEVELYPLQAPGTVKAFLSYVDSGLYANGSFYRVLNDDNQPSGSDPVKLVQGGIWVTNHAKASAVPGIPLETTQQTHILHKDGVISLARTGPSTGSTEFFICIGDQPGFDFGGGGNPDGLGYAAFGRVVNGMDAVKAIYAAPSKDQQIEPNVEIKEIRRD